MNIVDTPLIHYKFTSNGPIKMPEKMAGINNAPFWGVQLKIKLPKLICIKERYKKTRVFYNLKNVNKGIEGYWPFLKAKLIEQPVYTKLKYISTINENIQYNMQRPDIYLLKKTEMNIIVCDRKDYNVRMWKHPDKWRKELTQSLTHIFFHLNP